MFSSILPARPIQNEAHVSLARETSERKRPFGWQCLHWSGLAKLKRSISLIIQPRDGLFLKVRWIVRGRGVSSKMGECLSAAIYKISLTKVHGSLLVHVQKPGARHIELL